MVNDGQLSIDIAIELQSGCGFDMREEICVYMSCVPKNCMYAYIYIVTYSYSIHVHMLIHDSYKKLELHNSHQDSRSSSFLRISEKLPM